MLGIDLDDDAHAGAQCGRVHRALEPQPDGQPLDDLDPVAGRVLRRQQGEFGARRRADAGDDRSAGAIGEHIDVDRGALADLHERQVGFLVVGLDPDVFGGDDAEYGDAGGHVLARLQIEVGDDAVDRRVHLGVRKIERGAIAQCARLAHRRLLVGRARGIAAEPGADLSDFLRGDQDLVAGVAQRAFRRIHAGPRDDAGAGQRVLALVVLLLVGEIALGKRQARDLLVVERADRPDFLDGGGKLRFGAGERDAQRLGVDAEQQRAALDHLVGIDKDLDDAPRDIGADDDLVGLDVGVIGRNEAAAREVEVAADERGRDRPEERDRHDQREPPPLCWPTHAQRLIPTPIPAALSRSGSVALFCMDASQSWSSVLGPIGSRASRAVRLPLILSSVSMSASDSSVGMPCRTSLRLTFEMARRRSSTGCTSGLR